MATKNIREQIIIAILAVSAVAFITVIRVALKLNKANLCTHCAFQCLNVDGSALSA